jgi:hypothetical protein
MRYTMRRDMDLIRAILLDLEKNCDGEKGYRPTPESIASEYEGKPQNFYGHLLLIWREGFAEGRFISGGVGDDDACFTSLTAQGQKLLDKLRGNKD